MKERLIEILEGLGYPAYLQGSLNESDAFPDAFFTFWNFDSPEPSHYDNNPTSCSWGFWIYFYATNPRLVESVMLTAKKALKDGGFVVDGKPSDANSGRATHTGEMLTAYALEIYDD